MNIDFIDGMIMPIITAACLCIGSYTTLARATALNQEHYFVADKQYESFVVSINVASVPTDYTTFEKTYQAIVDACDYYGVKYIDMTHNNAIVNYLNITHVLPDGLHPSQNTYNRLAETIAHHAIG